MRLLSRTASCAVAAALLLIAPSARADVTFTGSSGSLAASAVFGIVGSSLTVTLTNTSTADVLVPADVLTALFFDIPSGVTLTPGSALLGSGSTVHFGPDGGGNVGGEWAYGAGLSGAPGGATRGISSAGFGLFGDGNFGGSNLQDPAAVDGLQYGLTSAGDNLANGNAAVTGGNALIQNSVVFTLSGLPDGFTLGDVSNVSFQYGTALTEPNVHVAEPGIIATLLLGILGVGVSWRKRSSNLG